MFGPVIGGAFIGTGLFAWRRRPENRFGALMVAVGFTYCLSGLIVTTDSWPFIAGLVADRRALRDPVPHPARVPVGPAGERCEPALVGASYAVATVGWWVCMVFEDTTRSALPANPLLIADEPDLFTALARTRLGFVAALIACSSSCSCGRCRGGDARLSAARSTPVYLSGGLVLALYAVWSVLGVPRWRRAPGDARARARDRAGDRPVRVPGRPAAQPRGRGERP